MILTMLISFQSTFASEYFCKDIYVKKIERLDKHPKLRKIGRVSISILAGAAVATTFVGSAIVVGSAAPALSLILLFPGGPFSGFVTTVKLIEYLKNKENDINNAFYLLENLESTDLDTLYYIANSDEQRAFSLIDYILERMGTDETKDKDWNEFISIYKDTSKDEQFEGLRQLLIKKSQTNEFCSNGKAMRLEKIIKQLKI